MKKSPTSSFNHNVFINCPIDEEYAPLFQVIVFTIHVAGFRPRCSAEANDSITSRLEKIMNIMADCKYGIHDISRTQLGKNRLPRFNMPFELGIDVGYRHSGNRKYRSKAHLILDTKRYRYQKFISDLAGRDLFAHHNKPAEVVRIIRAWLRTESGIHNMPSGTVIYRAYKSFKRKLPKICAHSNLDMDEITFADYSYIIADYLSKLKNL
jgi:hypothetical protein